MAQEAANLQQETSSQSLEISSGKGEKVLGIFHILAGILVSIAQFMFRPKRWFLDFGIVTPFFLFIIGILCFLLPSSEWIRNKLLPKVEKKKLLTASEVDRYVSFGRMVNLTVISFGWAWGILCQASWTSLFTFAITFQPPFTMIGELICEVTFLGIFPVYVGGLMLAIPALENALVEQVYDDVSEIHDAVVELNLKEKKEPRMNSEMPMEKDKSKADGLSFR